MHWMDECTMDATCGCKWLSTDGHVTTGTKVAEAVAAALGPVAAPATAVVLVAGPAVAGLGPTTAATTGLAVAIAETAAETTTGPSVRGPGLEEEEAEGEGLGPEASLTTVLNLAAGLGMTRSVHVCMRKPAMVTQITKCYVNIFTILRLGKGWSLHFRKQHMFNLEIGESRRDLGVCKNYTFRPPKN